MILKVTFDLLIKFSVRIDIYIPDDFIRAKTDSINKKAKTEKKETNTEVTNKSSKSAKENKKNKPEVSIEDKKPKKPTERYFKSLICEIKAKTFLFRLSVQEKIFERDLKKALESSKSQESNKSEPPAAQNNATTDVAIDVTSQGTIILEENLEEYQNTKKISSPSRHPLKSDSNSVVSLNSEVNTIAAPPLPQEPEKKPTIAVPPKKDKKAKAVKKIDDSDDDDDDFKINNKKPSEKSDDNSDSDYESKNKKGKKKAAVNKKEQATNKTNKKATVQRKLGITYSPLKLKLIFNLLKLSETKPN